MQAVDHRDGEEANNVNEDTDIEEEESELDRELTQTM